MSLHVKKQKKQKATLTAQMHCEYPSVGVWDRENNILKYALGLEESQEVPLWRNIKSISWFWTCIKNEKGLKWAGSDYHIISPNNSAQTLQRSELNWISLLYFTVKSHWNPLCSWFLKSIWNLDSVISRHCWNMGCVLHGSVYLLLQYQTVTFRIPSYHHSFHF